MRLAIVGASGQTGVQIIRQALDRGHRVIGVARSPAKIPFEHEHLAIRRADIFDKPSLVKGLVGADAVLTSVGKTNVNEKRPQFNTVSHRNIVKAAAANGIRRIVVISSFGAAQNVRRKGLRRKLYLYFRREYYGDMHAMERMVLESNFEATVVRAPMLHNRPPQNDWLLTSDGSLPAGVAICRADLAHFLLDELESGAHVGHTVAIADEGDDAPSFREIQADRKTMPQ